MLSHNSTLGPVSVFIPVPTLIPASALTPDTTNELFKQFMKAYLEFNQESSQSLVECKRFFKAKVLDVYYGKLHMDCYYFCQ